jgi:uncharacterized protein YdaU (DUF1376 family)
MNWYPRYYGDYMRDTADLSLVEHGAYTVLLDHYYATGQPLRDDEAAAMRICRAFTDEERAAVSAVLARFFPVNGDGARHNARADRELAKEAEIIKIKSRAGKAGARARWEGHVPEQTDGTCHAAANGKDVAEGMAERWPSTSTSTPTSEQPPPSTPQPPKGGDAASGFDAFWQAYPKKVGKIAARKAWKKAKRPPTGIILAAVEQQKKSDQWRKDNGQYIPNPATWLNQGRWDDEPTKAKGAQDDFIAV